MPSNDGLNSSICSTKHDTLHVTKGCEKLFRRAYRKLAAGHHWQLTSGSNVSVQEFPVVIDVPPSSDTEGKKDVALNAKTNVANTHTDLAAFRELVICVGCDLPFDYIL